MRLVEKEGKLTVQGSSVAFLRKFYNSIAAGVLMACRIASRARRIVQNNTKVAVSISESAMNYERKQRTLVYIGFRANISPKSDQKIAELIKFLGEVIDFFEWKTRTILLPASVQFHLLENFRVSNLSKETKEHN